MNHRLYDYTVAKFRFARICFVIILRHEYDIKPRYDSHFFGLPTKIITLFPVDEWFRYLFVQSLGN